MSKKEQRHIYLDTQAAHDPTYYFMLPSDVAFRHALFPDQPERYRHVTSVTPAGSVIADNGHRARVMKNHAGDSFHVFSDMSARLI